MPVKELPDSVVSMVIHLLNEYHRPGKSDGCVLWNKKMLSTACRHMEYFVTPLVSEGAARVAKAQNLGDLRGQRWRARSGWVGGEELYFEHAKPAADLLKELIDLGPTPEFLAVKSVLLTAEVAWITVKEERGLPKYKRKNWKEAYREAGIDLE